MARLRRIDSCRETTGRHAPCDSKVIGAFARLSQEFEPAQASLQRKSLWDECWELRSVPFFLSHIRLASKVVAMARLRRIDP